jgi:hypothetical protein
VDEDAERERQQQQHRQQRPFGLGAGDGVGRDDPEQSVQAEEKRVGEQGIAGQPDQAGKQEIDCRVRLDARIPLIEIGRRPLERAAPAEAGDQIGLRQMHRPVLGRHQFHQPERTIQQQRQRHESEGHCCNAGDVSWRREGSRHRHR